ncbi:MAG: hypothetical protein ABIQ39_08920 [Ilumatobacteraceae bacterium]
MPLVACLTIIAVVTMAQSTAAAPPTGSTGPRRSSHSDPPRSPSPPPRLQLISQQPFTIQPAGPINITVAVPPTIDLAQFTDPAGPQAQVRVISYGVVADRAAVATVVGGRLPPAIEAVTFDVSAISQPVTGQLALTIPTETAAERQDVMRFAEPGLYPLTVELRSGGTVLASLTTFINRDVDPGKPPPAPLSVAVVIGVDAPVELDSNNAVVLSDSTLHALGDLVRILETSAMPVTVAVAPQLLTNLRAAQPELAGRLSAVIARAQILSAPAPSMDPSAAAAADQEKMYTQWLVNGEDLLGKGDLHATVLRGATVINHPLSELGGELLRDLGTRLLLLPPSYYDTLDGSIGGYTDTTQLVDVELADTRYFNAAIVDRRMAALLTESSPTPALTAVYATADLLAARQEIADRGSDPRRHSVLLGTDQLGMPDPTTLAPITALIANTPGLAAISVAQLGARTDTLLIDGDQVGVHLPATTSANITDRITMQSAMRKATASTASMLDAADTRPAQWNAELDLLPSSSITDQRATDIVNSLNQQFDAIRAAVGPPPGLDFTLTGRTGMVRLKFRNSADTPLTVLIRVGGSAKITATDQTAVLAPHETTEVKVRLTARSNGRFPVFLDVLTPTGDRIANVRLTATVAALSGLGNLATGAALLVLLTWWARQVRRSRRRRRAKAALDRHPVGAAAAERSGTEVGLSPDAATSTLPGS